MCVGRCCKLSASIDGGGSGAGRESVSHRDQERGGDTSRTCVLHATPSRALHRCPSSASTRQSSASTLSSTVFTFERAAMLRQFCWPQMLDSPETVRPGAGCEVAHWLV